MCVFQTWRKEAVPSLSLGFLTDNQTSLKESSGCVEDSVLRNSIEQVGSAMEINVRLHMHLLLQP